MDRVGVTLLMLLSLALMRLSDSERRDSTGGTDDAASPRALVRDPQPRVIICRFDNLAERPEDSLSSTSSNLNLNAISETSFEPLLSRPARGTPENEHEPERASLLPRDSRRSRRHAPLIKPLSPHETDNPRDGAAPAPRDSAPRAARQVAHRSRVNHRQSSRHARRLAG